MCAAPFRIDRLRQLTCFQVFLNIVLDDAVEEKDNGEKAKLGMVVIRGNSVVMLEALERIGGDDRRER
jgi:small nuclear ribonucleoprotein G